MVLKTVLVDGEWVDVYPHPWVCPKCRQWVAEGLSECPTCKDLEDGEKRRKQALERVRCPECGHFLTSGHCLECNVQVILS